MMQVDLLAQIIAQHKFDIDASLDLQSLRRGQAMVCTCGESWLDNEYTDALWNLHVAQAILDALQPKAPQQEQSPDTTPLWVLEDEFDPEEKEK